MNWLHLALCAVIGYFLGSFSTGIVLGERENVDIRQHGSKNTGATNAVRVMGLRLGLLTFLGDFAKAAIAVLLGRMIGGRDGSLLAGLFAVAGHNWPIFYGFSGGKGIACSTAVLLLNVFPEGMAAVLVAILAIYLSRYVSLGSLSLLLTAALLLPFTCGLWPYGAWGFLLLLIGAYRHRSNIRRLLNGTESKFTGKKHNNV